MAGESSQKSAKVIIVTNLKGGVAKTTNTLHLARGLSEHGFKSLVIDFDSTGGATELMGFPSRGPWPSSYELLTGDEDPMDCVLTSENVDIDLPEGIDLVPGSDKLEELDAWLAQNKYRTQQDLLLGSMEVLRPQYDYIFIDLPPRVSPATVPSMKAADFVILCAVPEAAAVRDLARTWNDVQEARTHGLPIEILGILITSIRRPPTRLAKHLLSEVREEEAFRLPNDEPLMFKNDVGLHVAMGESQSVNKTLFDYEPDHVVCNEYRAIIQEMLDRINLFNNWARTEVIHPVAAPESVKPRVEGQGETTSMEEVGNG